MKTPFNNKLLLVFLGVMMLLTASAFAATADSTSTSSMTTSDTPWIVGAVIAIGTLLVSWIPTTKPYYDIVNVIWKVLTMIVKIIWPNHSTDKAKSIDTEKRSWIGRLVHRD